jgi:FAD/FMN-containing dehydrogenase
MIKRRSLIALAGSSGLSNFFFGSIGRAAEPESRTRPTDTTWPSDSEWNALSGRLEGVLERSRSAFDTALSEAGGSLSEDVLAKVTNPFFLQDFSGSTQSLGWLDAWQSQPSEIVSIPRSARDVSEIVQFAVRHNLRVVIKGGGHSYYGQSCSADSILIWTRDLRGITIHDDFVPEGGPISSARPAVSVASGERFFDLYGKCVVEHGRYVQGGGCTSVGVGGHAQSGGFGHFSKFGGMTGANLLEAEVVTANGEILLANRYQNADLYWALKGGGAGFGVTTRLTLATRDLPDRFGFIGFALQAADEGSYRELVAQIIEFTHQNLINPNWGEQIHFAPDHRVYVKMTFINHSSAAVRDLWSPILAFAEQPKFDFIESLVVYDLPAQNWWDLDYRARELPETIVVDEVSSQAGKRFFWNGDNGETNVFWGGYESAWLSQSLLSNANRNKLIDTIVAASRLIRFAFHFQKGLAGASEQVIEDALDTPVHPSVTDAFALLLVAAAQKNAIEGAPGLELRVDELRARGEAVRAVYQLFRRLDPNTGSYSAEMNFHEADWKTRAWGDNYHRLLTIKNRYDAAGLFTGHHQVGSEYWSNDGFTRVS